MSAHDERVGSARRTRASTLPANPFRFPPAVRIESKRRRRRFGLGATRRQSARGRGAGDRRCYASCGRAAGNLVWCLAMPISHKFVVNFTAVALAVGFLSLLAIIGATIWLEERAQANFDGALRLRNTRTAAVELRSALQSAESSQRGYLIAGNEIYLAPFDTAKAEARNRLRRVEELLAPTEPPSRRCADCPK